MKNESYTKKGPGRVHTEKRYKLAPGERALARHNLRCRHALTDLDTGKLVKDWSPFSQIGKGPAVTLPRRKGLTNRQAKRFLKEARRAARAAERASA